MSCTTTHSIICNARPDQVYRIIRQAHDWPMLFTPCLKVRLLEEDRDSEHLEVTALVNGEPMTWESVRHFLPDLLGIDSTMVKPMPLVKSMKASWRVMAINSQQSVLVLDHDYVICESVAGIVAGVATIAEAEAYLRRAIDANSTIELGNIRTAVENPAHVRVPPVTPLDGHSTEVLRCQAGAAEVYRIIRRWEQWPEIFDACLGATRVAGDEQGELVRIEADQDGQRVAWETQRNYHDGIHRIDYHLPKPMPFLASMRGQWRVIPQGDHACLLTVQRSWRLLKDIRGIRPGIENLAQAQALVERFITENSRTEMLAIRTFAEEHSATLTSFTSRYRLPHPGDAVYELLADAAAWPRVLPHCASLRMIYDDGRFQEFAMDIQTALGQETFRSIRQCEAAELLITYFQPDPPAVMARHHGSWRVVAAGDGCDVIAQHTVVIASEACRAAFGEGDPSAYKRRIRDLVGRNSQATIDACARWLAGAAVACAAAASGHE